MTLDLMMTKVYLIGATGGVGKLLAKALTEKGFYVIGIGRRENVLKDLLEKGLIKEYIVADITKKEDRKKILEKITYNDILFYNQGLIDPKTLEETTEEEIRKIFEVNIISIMLMDQEMILENRIPLKIVYMGSISSVQSWGGGAAYQATKTALLAYISAMRIQDRNANRKVERIGIYPDTIKTGGMDERLKEYPKIDGEIFAKEVANILAGEYKGLDFLFQIDWDGKVRLYRMITDIYYRRPQPLAKELIKELGKAVY